MKLALTLALAVGLVAASAPLPAQAPRVDASVPFAVGETLTYDVTYSSLVVAGSATSTVRGRQTSPPAYDIVVEGRPNQLVARLYNVLYRMETLLDAATLLPHRAINYAEEAGVQRVGTTTFDRTRFRGSFVAQGDQSGTYEFDIPPQTQDGLSAVYLVRTMTVRPGDSFSLSVADNGLLYNVRADIGAPESLTVPLGQFEALPVKLTIAGKDAEPGLTNASAWISTDRRRLPLRLQADLPVGSFVLLLRQVS